MARTLTILAVVALAVTGCGSDEPTDDAESLAEQTGCDTLTEEPTEELFVREKFACDDDATVYTFNNGDGKSGWLEFAETFGVVVLDEGDLWVKVEADGEAAAETTTEPEPETVDPSDSILLQCPADEGTDAYLECLEQQVAADQECVDDVLARWAEAGYSEDFGIEDEYLACY
jgi:hypothetical protein